MKGPRRFDHLSRYRAATFLFIVVYVMLMSRTFLHWPDWDRQAILTMWFVLTTPALILVLWNLAQSSIYIYRKRRDLDRMLDERRTQQEETM
jgi:hypothetical protein